MARKIPLLFVLFFPAFVQAQTPDWATSISTILYENCTVCHHEGSIAPFSLMSYDEAVTNGFSIADQVNSSAMPPWPPDPDYNHFADEKVLSEYEITAINDWVNGGMPSGDLNQAPVPPVYTNGPKMVDPDDTLHFAKLTLLTNDDFYRCLLVHSDYTETKYLSEVEIIPSNPAIVHHLFLFHDSSDLSYQKDLDDWGPGFFGGYLDGFSEFAELDMAWGPGNSIFSFPPGIGIEVPPGSDFIISLHYAPGSWSQADSTTVYIKWAEGGSVRTVSNNRLLHWHEPSLMNPPFIIPANTVTTFYEQSSENLKDQSLLALQPHMHLLGKSFEVFMVTEDLDTTNLLYIPQWDFYWQLGYFLTKVLKVPANAKFYGTGVYDNTTNNPDNPNNPPIDVYAGESTLEEMMSCRFSLMDYKEGDEDIILDSAFYTADAGAIVLEGLQIETYPVPMRDELALATSLPAKGVLISLIDLYGNEVYRLHEPQARKGVFVRQLSTGPLVSGTYFLTVLSGGQMASEKIVVH